MDAKKVIAIRLFLIAIGLFVAVTGFVFGFSGGQVNLIPFSGLTYSNAFSGFVLGALGILLSFAEVRILYRQYHWVKGNMALKSL